MCKNKVDWLKESIKETIFKLDNLPKERKEALQKDSDYREYIKKLDSGEI